MAQRSFLARYRFTLIALLFIAGVKLGQWMGWVPDLDASGRPVPAKSPPVITTTRSDKPAASTGPAPTAPAPASASAGPVSSSGRSRIGNWEELHNCTLVEDRGNDGDSFIVLHDGQRHTLRLYFVDCPEKVRHQHNGPRIAEQGQYFGGLAEEETTAVGEAARDFSLNELRAAPFTILSRWEPVFDSERHYAFVTVEKGDLAELLVRNGLCRIYTKGESRPGAPAKGAAGEKQRLESLEAQARTAKLGAWGKR